MTDETPQKRTGPPRPPSADAAPAGDPDDALRRLETMGTPGPVGGRADPVPPSPVVDPFTGPPPSYTQRPTGSSKSTPRSRPRAAARPTSTQLVARIAAPVVFLIAVIALIAIVVNSGVMGGADQPVVTPTVKATATKTGTRAATKKYVVKSGDSLSSIAVRFNTTTSDLLGLNPDLSGSTLVVGQRIVVPRQ